jgi:hypothetical protein
MVVCEGCRACCDAYCRVCCPKRYLNFASKVDKYAAVLDTK